jgi:alcohol dehydrogenase
MKALVLHGPRDLRYENVPDPTPRGDWILVKVKRVGICGTDKAFYKGTYKPGKLPIILGHEIVGEVVDVGENMSKDLIGRVVTTEINIPCRKCWYCLNGMYTHCPYREVIGISIDGGMAEYLVTRRDVIHFVDDLPPQKAVFTEPLAAIIEMIEMEPPKPLSRVAVIGLGPIGLLSIQVLKLLRPRLLVAVARRDSPKAKLAQDLGADEVVFLEDLQDYVKRKTPEGQGFDYVVEATGDPSGLELATQITRPRGVVAAKSTHGAPTTFNYTYAIVKELRIIGSRCGPFDKAIDLLRMGLVKTDPLVTGVYSLSRGVEAMEKSFERDQIKIHLIP